MGTVMTKKTYNKSTNRKQIWRRVQKLDTETGEYITTEEVEYVDYAQEKFFKLNTAMFFRAMSCVSGNARLVFSYILQAASIKSNLALLKQRDVAEALDLGKATVERCFVELQRVDTIRKKESCQWMINPEVADGCKKEEKEALIYRYNKLPRFKARIREESEGGEEDDS